jgi:1,4-dihydroxy-6-naphthoate synthase
MKLSLGFSPCPNDTFIFDALVNKKIDTGGLEFDVHLEDVQTLNEMAIEGRLDVTKISYGVLPLLLNDYMLLNSGGALGKGVGPLLISKNHPGITEDQLGRQKVESAMIAIPGENTTAHFLFSLAYPHASHKLFMRFDDIENFVLNPPAAFAESGSDILGVIIHENRFTYEDKGLHKIVDLGDYWEQTTGSPIPLGGIVVKSNLGLSYQVDSLIRKSIEFAFENYPAIPAYTKQHSQEMSEKVMRQHIDLYVNDYSIDLGDKGKAAVLKLMEVFETVNPNLQLPLQNLFADVDY